MFSDKQCSHQNSFLFVLGEKKKKVDKSEGVRSDTCQEVPFRWTFVWYKIQGCIRNADWLWGFWVPFCIFLITISPPFRTSVSPLPIGSQRYIICRMPCCKNCLGGKLCSLSAYCISHPENSECIWKVSVKGFNCPAKPLSAAFKDYPLSGVGFWQWAGNMRLEPASAAGSPSWHSRRLSAAHSHLILPQQEHSGQESAEEKREKEKKKSFILLENAD